MKLHKLIFILTIGVLFFLTGCAEDPDYEEQYIEVEKWAGDDNIYKVDREITSTKEVDEVRKAVDQADWTTAKASMARPADYRFTFQFTDRRIDAKAVLYELWISPDKDRVELVIDAESKYAQLNKKDSAVVIEIVTGDE
ncbi:hypothetical protein [Metabacillus indicus]|uniref:hypothetical protein n=1 Tax=Metabacillus indicus TaxID=246786 RepID=UPI0004938915|nr:hypothetical protein [Metabacillus indicus]KEZ47766.1 hypothetical protein AZ46_0220120 [Metabacillus indicus LMG 22858]